MDGDFGHLTEDADDPVGTPCPAPADGAAIATGAFWPAVEPGAVRIGARLQPNVTPARLRTAIQNAVLDAARDLAAWRQARVAEGYDSLADVPSRETIDDKTDYEHLWLRAVTELTAADLGGRLRGMNATHAGHDRADELETEEIDHRTLYTWAIRDFLGVSRVLASAI